MPSISLVVIGGSAGALDSLRRLVSALPADLPATVAVVMHLSPTSKSLLAPILSRSGPIPAEPATDGDEIRPGRIVVATANRHLVIDGNRFRVVGGAAEHASRPAINPLFRSAAEHFGPRVAGVVLSGVLDDGTSGLAAIKRGGGRTMAQDPLEALHAEMPQSAIDHVSVDVVAGSLALAAHIAGAVRGDPCPTPRPARRTPHEAAPPSPTSPAGSAHPSLRIVEERSRLTRRMLDRATREGHHHIEQLLAARLDALEAQAQRLRSSLRHHPDTP